MSLTGDWTSAMLFIAPLFANRIMAWHRGLTSFTHLFVFRVFRVGFIMPFTRTWMIGGLLAPLEIAFRGAKLSSRVDRGFLALHFHPRRKGAAVANQDVGWVGYLSRQK